MRILAQGLNGASDGFAETNGDLGSIRREEVIPELTHDVNRWRSVDTEPSRTRAGLMFGKERIGLLAYGSPKLVFRELL